MTAFFRSVKFRLTLWYAFILTVFLSLFAFLMYSELSKALYRDIDRSLVQQANAIDVSLSGYLDYPSTSHVFVRPEQPYRPEALLHPDLHRELAQSVRSWEGREQHFRRSTLMTRLITLDHDIILSNLKGWEREIIFPDYERDSVLMEAGSSHQTIHFHGKPIRLFYRIIRVSGEPAFIVQAAAPLHYVERTLSRLIFIIMVWIPAAVVAAGIAGWFLARRSLRPIDSMIRQASVITAAYQKERLPRTNTGDELDRLAATLNDMMDRLSASSRAVQEFSSNVSHELKTPLAIMRGEVDLALRKQRSSETLIETVQTIGEEINGMIRLVDDLMLLVRSDSRQLKFERHIISLSDIAAYVVSRFQDIAQTKGVTLNSELADNSDILGDEVYLKRLLSNLIDNAVKFTPGGGCVTVTVFREGKRVVIRVEDSGMGIEKEIQEKVFNRFYRTDQARSHEGAGLGLNIAQAICEGHQGRLSLSSQLNVGTTISASFPAAP